jgi:hypothetical protein
MQEFDVQHLHTKRTTDGKRQIVPLASIASGSKISCELGNRAS